MDAPAAQLLDARTISRAEALGLHARQIVEGYLAGEHASPFRGFSVEFTQHRPYVPGDDTKHLDWKVLGRTDRHYIKQYEHETNYVAHLLLDGSESMRYGSGAVTKLDYARRLAACLAYLILHQRDAVSLSIFDSRIRRYVGRTGSLASIHPIMAELAAFDPLESTRIGDVLEHAASQIRRRGIVILISDLFDEERQILRGIERLCFGGSEVIVMHVMDPFELEFPFEGLVEFDGLENQSRIRTRPRDIRQSYLREVEAFRGRIREGCERNRSHYLLVDTSRPMHELLGGYLAMRRRGSGNFD